MGVGQMSHTVLVHKPNRRFNNSVSRNLGSNLNGMATNFVDQNIGYIGEFQMSRI